MKGRLSIITAMLIFGSVGVFVKKISLSSSEIALLRAIIGSLFLIIISFALKKKLSFKDIKKNSMLLLLSGTAIGVNWILLFQAYKYTTVSNATLSYYFAPVFVIILAPVVLKEKLTSLKAGCSGLAMLGLFLIVNVRTDASQVLYNHKIGIVYGIAAAALYSSVIIMNKFIKDLSGFEITLVQLICAAFVLLPYVYARDGMDFSGITSDSIIFVLILGIVHTGIAYYLYFSAFRELKGQTIAVLSYVDPVSAVIIAAIFLREKMSFTQIIGGILILGSTFLSEKLENSNK